MKNENSLCLALLAALIALLAVVSAPLLDAALAQHLHDRNDWPSGARTRNSQAQIQKLERDSYHYLKDVTTAALKSRSALNRTAMENLELEIARLRADLEDAQKRNEYYAKWREYP